MSDHHLLEPGAGRTASSTDDAAVLRALLDVEAAWVRVQRTLGLVDDGMVQAVEEVCRTTPFDAASVAGRSEQGGSPVLPLLADLRAAVAQRSPAAAQAVHRGLTSQDVLDSALMLLARRSLNGLRGSLRSAGDALAGLADTHRGTLAVGRTLGQSALPTTFGLKAAGWLGAVDDVLAELDAVDRALPVQCGGAVGTLAAVEALAPGRALHAADLLAGDLGLAAAGRPWHTDRGPVTRLGDALVRAADTLGKIASDVVLLSRPELGELAEPTSDGRGASSTLPQKHNPVLSVLVRSVALEAPYLGAQLHTAAALAADERADGAWHAEWPALLRLLGRVPAAAAQLAEVLAGLQVDATAMRGHVDAAGPALLGERLAAVVGGWPAVRTPLIEALRSGASTAQVRELLRAAVPADDLSDDRLDDLLDPATYLGASDALVDRAITRHRALRQQPVPGAAAQDGA
ncbi:lyase family protein [Cellulomonas sp. KRMCY2]|uniref:lyase family protein n=1 Tax=Cellulomonas sp. KRMCY2 TaxID=1304865 RepID=UPI00045EB5A4|nr:lyase family protein [Cellulomonas sp. KRMCY2]